MTIMTIIKIRIIFKDVFVFNIYCIIVVILCVYFLNFFFTVPIISTVI